MTLSCWLCFYVESFSYTSHAGFLLCGEFLLHIPCWLHFLCGEFLLHIPCCLYFYAGSSSYTSQAAFTFMSGVAFIFMWGVSLTHPMLASFYAGSFSYTSRFDLFFISYTYRAGFCLCEELLSSAVYSENNPLRKDLGRSWPRRKVWKSHTQTREGSPRTTWTQQNKIKQELSEKWAQKWKRKKRNGSDI